MNLRPWLTPAFLVTVPGAMIASVACSTSGTEIASPNTDASTSDSSVEAMADGAADAGVDATADAPLAPDAASEGGPLSQGLHIIAVSRLPLGAAAGDAIPLQVVVVSEDGGIQPLPAGTTVAWTAPSTVAAQDPSNPGPSSALPAFGAQPTGIFVVNPYRTDRSDYTGTLFVIDPGTDDGGTLTVTAVVGDASVVTATLPVVPAPTGDPDAGYALFNVIHNCAGCHGATGDGSPPIDGGADAAPEYNLQGTLYPYPAPGLNNTSPGGQPNLAADPGWNAALLGMAAQGDIDNNGVALRLPMPDWLGKRGLDGGPLGAHDFADIYAYLKSQTQ